jgi:hypothetical protein
MRRTPSERNDLPGRNVIRCFCSLKAALLRRGGTDKMRSRVGVRRSTALSSHLAVISHPPPDGPSYGLKRRHHLASNRTSMSIFMVMGCFCPPMFIAIAVSV